MTNGIIIVDHGSRRDESNRLLEDVAAAFGRRFGGAYGIVEPAHMELAEPSIAAAYARCVQRGATRVVVCPFFLGPGKHWTGDIPRLSAEAAARFPQTEYHVTMPLGLDDLMLELLAKRVGFCVEHAYRCESCRGTIRSGERDVAASLVAASPAAQHHHHDAPASNANGQCSTCPFVVQADGSILDTRVAAAT